METEQDIVKYYINFTRSRITQLRLEKEVSEHRMSLDLDKSGSYIRGIVNALSMPSVKELFRIMQYFEMTPAEFFAPTSNCDSDYAKLCEHLCSLTPEQLQKVNTFIEMIK